MSIGAAVSRLDGPDKVTGAARYTADQPLANLAYGALVQSTIPSGRITRLATAAAASAPGVLAVLTHENMPRLGTLSHPPAGQSYLPLQDDRVLYEGQHVALVVGETLEQAMHAAGLVGVEYAPEATVAALEDALDRPITVTNFAEPDMVLGDLQAGFARADVVIERQYATGDRHHNPMEPSATIATWEGDALAMYESTQWVWGVRMVLATALGIPQEQIRVISSYVGGGFGCKGYVWPHQILAAVAARRVGRPVKLVLTRAQMYTSTGYQTATVQAVALGATRDGRLTAIRHESISPTPVFDDYVEYAALVSRSTYASPAIETHCRAARVNKNTPTPMRAPHEGLGMFALESAMDELAYELGVDPLELRLRNYAEVDPTSGKPFSSKALRECYRLGAERFRWAGRPMTPGSLRQERDLIGWGMASGIMTTFRFPARARVRLSAGGSVVVEAGCQEIGSGSSTVIPQVAAEVLGVPVERVRLRLGDTALPETGGTTGSSTTLSVGSAVQVAATSLRQALVALAVGPGRGVTPLTGIAVEHVTAADGRLFLRSDPTRAISYVDVLKSNGLDELEADGEWAPGPDAGPLGESHDWSMHTFSAIFAEVRVDPDFGIARLSRCVGAYSAGRIVNPKTARSQMTGGMIWGAGQAFLEHSVTDRRLGRFLSKNLAGYLVPVNADIPELDVIFVDEHDERASPIGARGIGELGAVGISAAIGNAVFHATGKRVRSLPITPEQLL